MEDTNKDYGIYKEMLEKYEKLSFVCSHFNPFEQTEPNSSIRKVFEELGIDYEKDDPLSITNKLLIQLHKTEDHLKDIKPNASKYQNEQ